MPIQMKANKNEKNENLDLQNSYECSDEDQLKDSHEYTGCDKMICRFNKSEIE